MNKGQQHGQVYICPMHADVRQAKAGACPKCGMTLLLEGTRFGLVRHMLGNRWMLAAMVVVMVAIMVTVFM